MLFPHRSLFFASSKMNQEYSLTVLLCASLLHESESALRVINGQDAAPGQYPYAVRIEVHKKRFFVNKIISFTDGWCSGAALSPTWSLTAAHCYRDTDLFTRTNRTRYVEEQKMMIRYGSPHIKPSENNNLSTILRVEYLRKPFHLIDGDIALVYSEPMKLSTYAKISAIDYPSLYGLEVVMVGFGLMRVGSSNALEDTFDLDKPLQVMDGMLRSCDDDEFDLTAYGIEICVVPRCEKAQLTFNGDSGGPIVHASGIVGVLKSGEDFIKSSVIDRYLKDYIPHITPVVPYLDWISATVDHYGE